MNMAERKLEISNERGYFGLDDFNPFSFPELEGEPLGLLYMIATCYERGDIPRGILSEVAMYYITLRSARYMLQTYRPTSTISGHRFYGGALRNHVKLAAVYDRKRVDAWRDGIDEIIESAKDQYVKDEVLEAHERVEDAEEALKKAKEELQEAKAQLTDARAWAVELEDESRQAMAKRLKLD